MSHGCDSAVILIMGATGTGKSTFINLLTGDNKIHIGHSQQSETFGVESAHFVDQETGRPVQLVDTPGFDDSREGVTDTDILEKIAQFLVPESGERIDITGIIYMHRISDPRVGGVSRKNIKMFYVLCGGKNLGNVCIVTTNWSRVTEDEGNRREEDLKRGAFKAIVDAGAQMRRHTDTFDSAQQVVSELISLPPVTLTIQEEVRAGNKLVDTGAGMVLEAEMQAMRRKNEQELADLEREIKDAEEEQTRSLIAELEQERNALQEKMRRANADRERLESTLAAAHVGAANEQGSRATRGKETATTALQRSSKPRRATIKSYVNDSTASGPPFILPSAESTRPKSSRMSSLGGQLIPYNPVTKHTMQPSTATPTPIALAYPITSGMAHSVRTPHHATTLPLQTPYQLSRTPIPTTTPTTEANLPFSSNEAQIRALLSTSAETRQVLSQPPLPLLDPYGTQFTIPPAGGFPHIELLTPTELLEHLDDELLNNWFSVPHPKLLIRPFKWQGPNPTATVLPLAQQIGTSVCEIASAMGLPDITGNISPPYAPPENATGLPKAFLVYGIPNQLVEILLGQHVWSSTKVTFEACAFGDTQPPALFLALSGFTTLNHAIVKQAVQRCWSSEQHHILAILREHITSSALDVLQTAIKHLIETIKVERVNTNILPRYNIYSDNPACISPTAWTAVRLYLAKLEYPTTKDGIGTRERLIPCLICHSHAHPPEFCPFPAIPGWNGPTLRQGLR